jgi:tripartite ATP-independent transporter DctP family solute receptor
MTTQRHGLTGGMFVAALTAFVSFSGAAHAQFKERSIRVSTGVSKEHPDGMAMVKMAQCMAEKTGGKFKQRNFFDGSLGSELAASQQVRSGTLDAATLAPSPLIGSIPELAVLDLPFLFNNNREIDAFFNGPVIDHFREKYRSVGLEFLSYWEYGFRHATNSKRPITKWEDMQGLKFRVMQNKVYIDTFSSFGTNPVPLAFAEVYSALETKTVDGQENPIMAIDTMKFFEVQKYLSLTRHSYSPLAVVYSKKLFDTLSKEESQAVRDCAEVGRTFALTAVRDLEAKSIDAMKKAGLQVNEITPAELARMRERVKPVWDSQAKVIGEPTMSFVQGELKRIRAE